MPEQPEETKANNWSQIFPGLFSFEKPGDELVHLLSTKPAGAPSFLNYADEISAGPKPWHTGSVLAHLARCMNETAGDPLAVWMAMAHDAGKLTTPRKMLPHHYGHELRGKYIAALWAEQMALPPKWREAGELAADQHMRAAKYPFMRPGKKLSLLRKLADSGLEIPFWKVVNADTHSRLGDKALEDATRVAEWQKEGVPEQDQILMLAKRWKL